MIVLFNNQKKIQIKLRLTVLFILPLLLVACEQQQTYQYLVTHPFALKKELTRCEARVATAENIEKNTAEADHCAVVTRAASVLIPEIERQQMHPESYGDDLLALQIACDDARKRVLQTRQQLAKLHNEGAATTEIDAVSAQLENENKIAEELSFKAEIAMGVLSLTTPK